MIQEIENQKVGRTSFEVLEYETLAGNDDPKICQTLYYVQQTGTRLKQLRVRLQDSSVTIESGALQFLRGRIEMTSDVGGVSGFFKKMASKVLSDETAFKPRYTGTGELWLEPSFGHYLLVELNDETMFVDRGMYLASSDDLDVGVGVQSTVSSTVLGDEGFFQTKIAGTGVCALQSPVPSSEVVKLQIQDETVQVDGNFALLRKGDVSFTVEKSSAGVMGTFTGGEGLLHTFRGTGEVWLAPTQPVYAHLKAEGLKSTQGSQRSSEQTVETTPSVE